MPRVSVLIPVFNRERYLAQAIQSVLSQSFADFELLLLNDGSDDRSGEIAAHAAKMDNRVVLVDGPRHGVVYQRNLGVKMAKANLIALMDSDDISLPGRLASQVLFMEARPECVALGTQALRIDEDGLPINEWRVPESHEQIDAAHMNGESGMIINPTAMMRKHAVLQAGGYRDGFYNAAEDYDLFLRLGEIGQLANLPQVLLQYRLHVESLTWARAEQQRLMVRRALQDAWDRRKLPPPMPPPFGELRAPSEDELIWEWARFSFYARNFRTTRNQALKLLRRRPKDLRRWLLFCAACCGPVASKLKRTFPYYLWMQR